MKHHTEPFTSVPELQQQVFTEWYAAEWPNQQGAPSTASHSQAIKPIALLSGIISRLIQPTGNAMALLRVRIGLRRVFPLQDPTLGQ